MSLFTNKHLIIAMLVAPILAVLSWLMVDNLIGEKPHKAVAGGAYPLVAKSNCRFTSGACDLENGDLKIRLSVDEQNRLTLNSSHPLQTATFGIVDDTGKEQSPMPMTPSGSQENNWSLALADTITANTVARLAVQAQDTFYYAETVMAFSNYQTIFDKDLRKSTD